MHRVNHDSPSSMSLWELCSLCFRAACCLDLSPLGSTSSSSHHEDALLDASGSGPGRHAPSTINERGTIEASSTSPLRQPPTDERSSLLKPGQANSSASWHPVVGVIHRGGGKAQGEGGPGDGKGKGEKDGAGFRQKGGEFGSELSILSMLDDEDTCPTCLDPFTEENPKVITKCGHHYHLPCIFEWQERSPNCPMCGKKMEYSESV